MLGITEPCEWQLQHFRNINLYVSLLQLIHYTRLSTSWTQQTNGSLPRPASWIANMNPKHVPKMNKPAIIEKLRKLAVESVLQSEYIPHHGQAVWSSSISAPAVPSSRTSSISLDSLFSCAQEVTRWKAILKAFGVFSKGFTRQKKDQKIEFYSSAYNEDQVKWSDRSGPADHREWRWFVISDTLPWSDQIAASGAAHDPGPSVKIDRRRENPR